MITNKIRSYEVSLWTLQDEFITVLKWSDAEQEGRIQNPKLTIDIDGTQSFTFSIPMYINARDVQLFGPTIKLIENPLWFDNKQQNLLKNMRKIKVIFNKGSDDECVLDFLIIKVTDEHEEDESSSCQVECEGLAFHELGKIGYKYSLNLDDYKLVYEDWIENGCVGDAPKANVNFWCEKIGLVDYTSVTEHNPAVWYYKIEMDWSSYYTANTYDYAAGQNRLPNKVYEEEFVTSWDVNLHPLAVERAREKERMIEVSESNIYNITQTIAEQFGIHCRYEYKHDANYNISERIVVFYNNFMKEKDGIISFTYPYSISVISRETDATDLTTKLFIKSVDDDNLYEGQISIMNTEANKLQDDYLLNFDYLHSVGAITEEQYAAIDDFEKDIHQYNSMLSQTSQQLISYKQREIELKAKLAVYNNSLALDQEQIDQNSDLFTKLDSLDHDLDGLITRNASNPDQIYVQEDANGNRYVDFTGTEKGIKGDTLVLYGSYNYGTYSFNNITPITGYQLIYDEFGNLAQAYNLPSTDSNFIFAIYKYDPQLYYDNIVDAWKIKLANDTEARDNTDAELTDVQNMILALSNEYDRVLALKEECVKEFEHMMGAALREGYWSPENYQDYGERHTVTAGLDPTVDMIEDAQNEALIGWDSELFDDEQKLYYEVGVNQTKVYYPCIDLSQVDSDSGDTLYDIIKDDPNSFSFMYSIREYENEFPGHEQEIQYLRIFAIGSQALIRFVKYDDTIKPVLVIIGASQINDDELAAMKTAARYPCIGKISTEYDSERSVVVTTIDPAVMIDSSWFLTDVEQYTLVYPRIKISSLLFKNTEDDLAVLYDGTLLERYQDYVVASRITERDNINYPEYFITLKIDNFMNMGYNKDVTVNFTLSNAGTAIYLDAEEVLKENAYPKVSYEMTANIVNTERIRTAYKLLGQLIMITDVDLKLYDTFGYISHLELDLDQPQNDEYEVKNYKTKFEDLFSSIVAETEEMKKSGDSIASIAAGQVILNAQGLSDTLNNNTTVIDQYLDDYVQNSEAFNNVLSSLFDDAATILSQSNSLYGSLQTLNAKNASILKGLQDEMSGVQPKVFRQANQPINFKTGDIWIQIGEQGSAHEGETLATYIAISDSRNCTPGHGFTKTYCGDAASITGQLIDIDAVEGTINLGVTNIDNVEKQASINLVASGFTGHNYASLLGVSQIHLDPSQIKLQGARIDLLAGQADGSTSAILLDGAEGIWIGTNKSIRLYSGGPVTVSDVTTYGTDVELTPERILFGASASGSATFMEMTAQRIYMGAASNKTNLDNNVPSTSLAGVDISPSGIIMAAENNNGNSIVSVLPTGVSIASGASLNVQTANVILDSTATGSSKMFYIADNSTWNSATTGIQYTPNGGLQIKGAIEATSFILGSGATIPWTSITNAPNFTIDGLSTQWHKYYGYITMNSTIANTLPNPETQDFDSIPIFNQNTAYNASTLVRLSDSLYIYYLTSDHTAGTTWENTSKALVYEKVPDVSVQDFDTIPVFDSSIAYATNTLVKLSNSLYDGNVYYLYNGHAASVAWADTSKVLVYKKAVNLTSSNALVLGANNGFYIIGNATDSLNTAKVTITNNAIKLDHSESNYIHMDSNGIDVAGSRITINGKEVWGRDDIIFCAASSETEFDHPTDRDWVWIRPNDQTSVSGQASISSSADGTPLSGLEGVTRTISIGDVAFTPNVESVNIICYLNMRTLQTASRAVEANVTLELWNGSTKITELKTGYKTLPRGSGWTEFAVNKSVMPSTAVFNTTSFTIKFTAVSARSGDMTMNPYSAGRINNVRLVLTKSATSGQRLSCNVYYFSANS